MAKGCRHQEQTCCSHIYTVLKRATNNHTDRDTHNLPAWMHISLLTLVVYCRSSDDLLHVWDDPKLTSHSVVDVQVMSGLLRVMRVLELLDWMSFEGWRRGLFAFCVLHSVACLFLPSAERSLYFSKALAHEVKKKKKMKQVWYLEHAERKVENHVRFSLCDSIRSQAALNCFRRRCQPSLAAPSWALEPFWIGTHQSLLCQMRGWEQGWQPRVWRANRKRSQDSSQWFPLASQRTALLFQTYSTHYPHYIDMSTSIGWI